MKGVSLGLLGGQHRLAQASHDERGQGGGRGSEADRNVELLIRNPFAAG